MLNTKAIVQLFLIFLLKLAQCDIYVYRKDTKEIEMEFRDVASKFGGPIPPSGLIGLVVYSHPPDACSNIDRPPYFQNYTGLWIVLIQRYSCKFEQKIRYAQEAGYDAAIVHNVDSNILTPMTAEYPVGIHIPSVFIGSESGLIIKNNYLYNDGYFILITDYEPFNFTSQLLIIFSVLIGFCFFVVIFFLIVKYFKDRRRQRRYCLSKSLLRKIPIHKFKQNDPYETCAICLDEYIENDKLRVLPCSHAYHSKCIDPWLTKNRKVCPVCKRKVCAVGEKVTDSGSDTEDETAPLVGSSGNATNGGTFSTPLINPLRRWASSDSSSDYASISTGTSISSNSGLSLPEPNGQIHRPGGLDEVRQEYSINSGMPAEVAVHPGRRSNQRSGTRNGTERC